MRVIASLISLKKLGKGEEKSGGRNRHLGRYFQHGCPPLDKDLLMVKNFIYQVLFQRLRPVI